MIRNYRKENEYVYVALASMILVAVALVGKTVNNILLVWVSAPFNGHFYRFKTSVQAILVSLIAIAAAYLDSDLKTK